MRDVNKDNINDVFSNLMSGDNPMKFMNLIQNVGQKIHSKLENKDLDQGKLVGQITCRRLLSAVSKFACPENELYT